MASASRLTRMWSGRVLAQHDRPNSGEGGPSSWLAFLGPLKDSPWRVDLFRWESILLRSRRVLVVMDQVHAWRLLCSVYPWKTTVASPEAISSSFSLEAATSQIKHRSPSSDSLLSLILPRQTMSLPGKALRVIFHASLRSSALSRIQLVTSRARKFPIRARCTTTSENPSLRAASLL
jgi:hypothetical protein